MSSTKICSFVDIVIALYVTILVLANPANLRAAKQQGGAVLFFVAYQGSLRDVEFNPIIFQEVLVNQGSAYNNNTGVFTATVPGVYQFVFAAQLCRGDHNNMWNFIINGDNKMFCHAQISGTDTTLNTCYLMSELQKGDRVWIKQQVGSCAWASTKSKTITFSGVLLASEGVSMLGEKYGLGSSCPVPGISQKRSTSGCTGQSVTLSGVAVCLLLCCLLLL